MFEMNILEMYLKHLFCTRTKFATFNNLTKIFVFGFYKRLHLSFQINSITQQVKLHWKQNAGFAELSIILNLLLYKYEEIPHFTLVKTFFFFL